MLRLYHPHAFKAFRKSKLKFFGKTLTGIYLGFLIGNLKNHNQEFGLAHSIMGGVFSIGGIEPGCGMFKGSGGDPVPYYLEVGDGILT
jgi:hypothetical protein